MEDHEYDQHFQPQLQGPGAPLRSSSRAKGGSLRKETLMSLRGVGKSCKCHGSREKIKKLRVSVTWKRPGFLPQRACTGKMSGNVREKKSGEKHM